MTVMLEGLVVGDEPATWTALGFAVRAGRTRVGGIDIELAGTAAGRGIVGWRLRGITGGTDLDGLATEEALGLDAPDLHDGGAFAHPNGAVALDHVVAFTGDFDRTTAVLERAGMELRRVREVPGGPVRQGFFLLGRSMLELAGPVDGHDAAAFWGLTVSVADLDAAVGLLGEERVGAPRDAVQPGRRIATVRREAGSSVPLALMTPR